MGRKEIAFVLMDEVSLRSEAAAEPDVDGVLVIVDAAEEKFATNGVGEEGGVGVASDRDRHVKLRNLRHILTKL